MAEKIVLKRSANGRSRVYDAVTGKFMEEIRLDQPVAAPAAAPARAKAKPVSAKVTRSRKAPALKSPTLELGGMAARGVWYSVAGAGRIGKYVFDRTPTKVKLATLAGAGVFMGIHEYGSRLAPGSANNGVAVTTGMQDAQAPSVAETAYQVPYSAADMEASLVAVNQFNYAPYQQEKINAWKATEYELKQVNDLLAKAPSNRLDARRINLEKQRDTQVGDIKPNTKLDVMNGAKWALLDTSRGEMKGGLKGVPIEEIFGFFIAKSRVESALTNDAEFQSSDPDHARGVVQLQTTPFLTLLARHYQAIGQNWPASDRQGFDSINRDLAAIGGGNATMDKLNAARPDLQARLREALVDKTPIIMPDGSQTSRGVYLSFVIAQYYIDEAPKLPEGLAKEYGANPLRYLSWQMGSGRYNTLIDDTAALDKFDEKAATSALNRLQAARQQTQTAQKLADAILAQQRTIQDKLKGLQPKKLKRGKAIIVIPQTATQKQQQAILTAQQKPLKAKLAQQQKQVSALKKREVPLEKQYRKLNAPLETYHSHILFKKDGKWRGQAASNPMWWTGKPLASDLRMPRQVLEHVRDDLKMERLSNDAERLAANWITPLTQRDYKKSPEVFAHLPRLAELDHQVRYLPAGTPEPMQAARPNRTRVAFDTAPKAP